MSCCVEPWTGEDMTLKLFLLLVVLGVLSSIFTVLIIVRDGNNNKISTG